LDVLHARKWARREACRLGCCMSMLTCNHPATFWRCRMHRKNQRLRLDKSMRDLFWKGGECVKNGCWGPLAVHLAGSAAA
jgi:hypothetical protein